MDVVEDTAGGAGPRAPPPPARAGGRGAAGHNPRAPWAGPQPPQDHTDHDEGGGDRGRPAQARGRSRRGNSGNQRDHHRDRDRGVDHLVVGERPGDPQRAGRATGRMAAHQSDPHHLAEAGGQQFARRAGDPVKTERGAQRQPIDPTRALADRPHRAGERLAERVQTDGHQQHPRIRVGKRPGGGTQIDARQSEHGQGHQRQSADADQQATRRSPRTDRGRRGGGRRDHRGLFHGNERHGVRG